MAFLCSDCDNGWEVPSGSIFALVYWIFGSSVIAYGLLVWGSKYAQASVSLAFGATQPVTAAILSEILIASNVRQKCHEKNDYYNCLYGASWNDLGSIGIIIGLFFVIYSDHKQNQSKLAKEKEIDLNNKIVTVGSRDETVSQHESDDA